MTFRVGQRVVCVNANDWLDEEDEVFPLHGEVYTIRDIIPYADGICGLLLCEIVNRPQEYDMGFLECTFLASRFRPIVDRKTDISFMHGADPSSDQFDNRRVRVGASA